MASPQAHLAARFARRQVDLESKGVVVEHHRFVPIDRPTEELDSRIHQGLRGEINLGGWVIEEVTIQVAGKVTYAPGDSTLLLSIDPLPALLLR